MNTNANDAPPTDLESRLVRIESIVAHLQHDIDELNVSLLTHLQRLQKLEDRCERLETGLAEVGEQGASASPADERPPHY